MMNDTQNKIYTKMAEEYFISAGKLEVFLNKLKSNKKLKEKNPKEYNSQIACIRTIRNECISTGNILKRRAERYENA